MHHWLADDSNGKHWRKNRKEDYFCVCQMETQQWVLPLIVVEKSGKRKVLEDNQGPLQTHVIFELIIKYTKMWHCFTPFKCSYRTNLNSEWRPNSPDHIHSSQKLPLCSPKHVVFQTHWCLFLFQCIIVLSVLPATLILSQLLTTF